MLESQERIAYNRSTKESTHSKSGCHQNQWLYVLTDTAHPAADRVSILFAPISLIEKGDQRYEQASKGH